MCLKRLFTPKPGDRQAKVLKIGDGNYAQKKAWEGILLQNNTPRPHMAA